MARSGPPRRRGYLLLEAVVSAAVLGIALLASMTFIGDARFETSVAANRARASGLALATTAAVLGMPHTLSSQAMAPVADHPGFRLGYTVTVAPNVGSSTPALPAGELHLITVDVQYPTSRAPETLTVQRLKRRLL